MNIQFVGFQSLPTAFDLVLPPIEYGSYGAPLAAP